MSETAPTTSNPQGTPSTQVTNTPVPRRSVPLWAVVIACAATVVFAGLWITTKSDLDSTKGKLSAANEIIDTKKAQDTAAEAAEAALPNVLAVVTAHVGSLNGYDITGDETYADVTVTGPGLYDITALEAALAELGFPPSIGSQLGHTRALDGTLTAHGNKVSASWTYHPDDGLNLIITRD